MKVTEKDYDFMVDCQERDIATLLVEDKKLTIHQALDTLYNSRTYGLLHNPKTGLFFQSPKYVYSILKEELDSAALME